MRSAARIVALLALLAAIGLFGAIRAQLRPTVPVWRLLPPSDFPLEGWRAKDAYLYDGKGPVGANSVVSVVGWTPGDIRYENEEKTILIVSRYRSLLLAVAAYKVEVRNIGSWRRMRDTLDGFSLDSSHADESSVHGYYDESLMTRTTNDLIGVARYGQYIVQFEHGGHGGAYDVADFGRMWNQIDNHVHMELGG